MLSRVTRFHAHVLNRKHCIWRQIDDGDFSFNLVCGRDHDLVGRGM